MPYRNGERPQRRRLVKPYSYYDQLAENERYQEEVRRTFQFPKPPDMRIQQYHHILEQFKRLSTQVLVQMIDELRLIEFIDENKYTAMTKDVYNKAKHGYNLSDKQRMVLINLIIQTP